MNNQTVYQDLNAELQANLDLLEKSLVSMVDFSIKLFIAELTIEKSLNLPRGAADLGEAMNCTDDHCAKVRAETEKIMQMSAQEIMTQGLAINNQKELYQKNCYELIKAGANHTTSNSNGNAYIHLASFYFIELLEKQVTEQKFNINMKNKQGLTPLQYCYALENEMEVKLLNSIGSLNLDLERLWIGNQGRFIEKGMKLIALGADPLDCDGKQTSFEYLLSKTALRANSAKLFEDVYGILEDDKNIRKYREIICQRAHAEEENNCPTAMQFLNKSLGFWAVKVIEKATSDTMLDTIHRPIEHDSSDNSLTDMMLTPGRKIG